jgi:hypothetical protein
MRGWIYGRLAVDEVIVLYIERVIFRKYTPKKHKCFGIKIYTLTRLDIHMIWWIIRAEPNRTLHNTSLQVTQQYQNWHGEYKDVATNVTWTINFPPRPVR